MREVEGETGLYVKIDYIDDLIPQYIEHFCTVEGSLYCFLLSGHTNFLAYREDLPQQEHLAEVFRGRLGVEEGLQMVQKRVQEHLERAGY